jgi:hypothetical protein
MSNVCRRTAGAVLAASICSFLPGTDLAAIIAAQAPGGCDAKPAPLAVVSYTQSTMRLHRPGPCHGTGCWRHAQSARQSMPLYTNTVMHLDRGQQGGITICRTGSVITARGPEGTMADGSFQASVYSRINTRRLPGDRRSSAGPGSLVGIALRRGEVFDASPPGTTGFIKIKGGLITLTGGTQQTQLDVLSGRKGTVLTVAAGQVQFQITQDLRQKPPRQGTIIHEHQQATLIPGQPPQITPAQGVAATTAWIHRGPPVLEDQVLPPGEVGVPYRRQLATVGGMSPFTYSSAAGGVPGLQLSPRGELAGTPTKSGSFALTVQVSDANHKSTSEQLTVTIAAPLAILSPSFPPAEVGVAYHFQLQAQQGVPPYAWTGTITGCGSTGSCPGLTVGSDGTVSGQPEAPGPAQVSVTVSDALGMRMSGAYPLTVSSHVAIVTSALQTVCPACGAKPQNLVARDGVQPYTWKMVGGNAPVTVTPSGEVILDGKAVPGKYSFDVTLTDGINAVARATIQYTVTASLAVITSSLPDTEVGVAYHQQLQAGGGKPPYTWSGTITECRSTGPCSTLPIPPDGSVQGTPDAPGSVRVQATVADTTGDHASFAYTFTIHPHVSVGTPALHPVCLACGEQAQDLQAAGGVLPYSWLKSGGNAPVQVSSTGEVTLDKDAAAGQYQLVVTVTDGLNVSSTRTYSYAVVATLTVQVAQASATVEDQAQLVYPFTISGGLPPYAETVKVSGSACGQTSSDCPGWAVLPDGSVTGTFPAEGDAVIEVTVTDALNETASAQMTLQVLPHVQITTQALRTIGPSSCTDPSPQLLQASGGLQPYSWQKVGDAPVTVSASGAVAQASNAQPGHYQLQVMVTDQLGVTDTRTYDYVVCNFTSGSAEDAGRGASPLRIRSQKASAMPAGRYGPSGLYQL